MAEIHPIPPTIPELQSRGRHVEVFTACHRLLGGGYQDGHLSASRFYRYLHMFVTPKDGSALRLLQVQDGWDDLGDYVDPDDNLLADGAYLVPYCVEERHFHFYDMLMD
jgi:hypothetical protein